jgi:hypothetical protein
LKAALSGAPRHLPHFRLKFVENGGGRVGVAYKTLLKISINTCASKILKISATG